MNKLIVVLFAFLFCSSTFNIDNCQSQWVQVSTGIPAWTETHALSFSGNNIYAGTVGGSSSGVFISTNNGSSWIHSTLNDWIQSIVINGNYIFAGTDNHGVWRSINNGGSWIQTSFPDYANASLATISSNIFAGYNDYGVFRSTNFGDNWIHTPLNDKTILTLYSNSENLYAGTVYYGVNLTTDYGVSWSQIGPLGQNIRSIAVIGDKIFAGTEQYGIYMSTNNGMNWIQSSLGNKYVYALAVSGNNLFAGIYNDNDSAFLVSTNFGVSWTDKSEGFPINLSIHDLLIVNNYIFAGVGGVSNTVWRRPLSEIIGIQNISTELPSTFSLYQNYPNPFNPTTNIRFDLRKNANVKLVIFDALGREMATIVNESLKPGTYEVDWSSSEYPSGVYFYRLATESFVDVKKMLLVK